MKRNKILLSVSILLSTVVMTLPSCDSKKSEATDKHEHGENHNHTNNYQCPMQCEGEKAYSASGDCPKCGMDLEEIGGHSH